MKSFLPILNATKYVCGSILILGIALFLYGFFVSYYGNITGIGIGTIMGAVFIFVMGIFLVASEEMVTKIRGRKAK